MGILEVVEENRRGRRGYQRLMTEYENAGRDWPFREYHRMSGAERFEFAFLEGSRKQLSAEAIQRLLEVVDA